MPKSEKSGRSSNTSLDDGESKFRRFDLNRLKGFSNILNYIYKPAFLKTSVAIAKEPTNFLTTLSILVQTLQLISIVFSSIDMGSDGNRFGEMIRYLQFEFIIFESYEMNTLALTGWSRGLSITQLNVMWSLSSIALSAVLLCWSLVAYMTHSFAIDSFNVGVTQLRLIRYLILLISGIFYIPIMDIFISSIVIGNPGLNALGVLGLLLMIPLGLYFNVVLLHFSPLSKSFYSRPTSIIELTDAILRTTLPFLGIILFNIPLARAVLMMIIGLVMMIIMVVMFPYYHFYTNVFRFVISSWLFEVGVVTTAAAATVDQQNRNAFSIALITILSVLTVVFAKLYQMAYKRTSLRLYNKLKNYRLKGTVNEYMLGLETEKFQSPYEVELCTRFIRENATLKKSKLYGQEEEVVYDKQDVKIAKAIYSKAIKQFPESPIMLNFFGIFHGICYSDYIEWKTCLDQTEDLFPNLWQTILLVQSSNEREHLNRQSKSGSNLDAMDLLEIKNSLKIAKKRCHNVKEYAAELWKMMLTSKVDPGRVQKLISKMYVNEYGARQIYDRTLARYPESLAVATAFATFLDEVARDYDYANEIWTYASELETKQRNEMEERRKQNKDTAIMAAGLESSANILVKVTDAEEMSAQQSERSLAVSSKSSATDVESIAKKSISALSAHSSVSGVSVILNQKRSISAREIRKFTEYRKSVSKLYSNAVHKTELIMKAMFLVFVIAPVLQFSWLLTINSQIEFNIGNIRLSSFRREVAVEIPYKLSVMKKLIARNSSVAAGFDKRFYYLTPDYETNANKNTYVSHSSGIIVPWEYYTLEQNIYETLSKFETIQSTLFFSADQNAPLFAKWISAAVPLNIWRGENVSRWNNPLSFWDASSEFWRHGRNILRKPNLVSMYQNENCNTDYSWRFFFDNSPLTYADSYSNATYEYTLENTRRITELLQTSWIILGVSGGALLLIALFFVLPNVSAIFNEGDLSTAALLAVPKVAIEASYGKLRQIMNIKDKKKTEKVDDIQDESDSGSDDDEMLIIDDGRDAGAASRDSLYWRYALQYILALLVIIGSLAIYTSVTYTNCLSLIQWGIRTDLSLRIRYVLWRLAYGTHMLVENDVYTYPDVEMVRTQLMKDLDSYNIIQLALLFGNPSMGLDKGRLPEILKTVMFNRIYIKKTSTIDQMVNVLLQCIAAVARADLPMQESNINYQRLVERVPLVVKGFGLASNVNSGLLEDQLSSLTQLSIGLFILCILSIIISYNFITRTILKGLRDEYEKAKRMLYQVPIDSAKINYPLQVLVRGPAAALEMYVNHDIPGIRLTSDGIPIPKEKALNIDYMRIIVSRSRETILEKIVRTIRNLFMSKEKRKGMKQINSTTLGPKSGSTAGSRLTNHTKDPSLNSLKDVLSKDDTPDILNLGAGRGGRRLSFVETPSDGESGLGSTLIKPPNMARRGSILKKRESLVPQDANRK